MRADPAACFHVSLSRTIVLQYHQIDRFVDDVRRRMALHPRSVHGMARPLREAFTPRMRGSFAVTVDGWRVFVNDEGTRSFIGLLVSEGADMVSPREPAMSKARSSWRR